MTEQPSAKARDAVLQRLMALHPKLIDLTLDRVYDLLKKLDDPHKRLAPVIHVAGTNGKGSVIAYLRAMLEAAGYNVHVYTSPHLVKFNERIRLAGEIIDDESLVDILEHCERVNAGVPITYFEITTVAALFAFAHVPADIVLLETGLGGRLDATNVIASPALTAITPIGLDHQQFLGDTLTQIASEKAGIMKREIPCVIAEQDPDVLRVLEARATEKFVPLVRAGFNYHFNAAEDGMQYAMGDDRVHTPKISYPRPALPGDHQLGNAAQSLACLDTLKGFHVSHGARKQGLLSVDWPARLQQLTSGPLVERLGDASELWLDGGHNPHASGVIRAHAADHWQDKPLHVICGLMNTKDPAGFLSEVMTHGASLSCIDIPGEANTLSGAALKEVATGQGLQAETFESASAALENIIAVSDGPVRVLICGSLYLAGTVLLDHR